MSDGVVCICRHYIDHHSQTGRCLFEWHGKMCTCKQFKEDDKAMTLGQLFGGGKEAIHDNN